MYKHLIFLFLCCAAQANGQTDTSIVEIDEGLLQGNIRTTTGGRLYREFLGIPYALPPLLELRFQPPVPIESWANSGTRQATQFGSICTQYDVFPQTVLGMEDCLYINVWTPQLSNVRDTSFTGSNLYGGGRPRLLPVMVYFSSGAFMFFSGNVNSSSYVMDENIVLVTFNYRLGSFGFLNTGDSVVSGNMGMKDQILALKWIQRNIRNFGGDPRRVTLYGESAGAAITHYHMLSPLSKGLFKNAIASSGSAFCPWSFSHNPTRYARQIAQNLNCPTGNSQELVDCLRTIPAEDIAQQHRQLFVWNTDPILSFGPSLENVTDPSQAFLTEPLINYIRRGVFNGDSWVIGTNTEEGLFHQEDILGQPQLTFEINRDWNIIAPVTMFYEDTALVHPQLITDQLSSFFYGNAPISRQTENGLNIMYGDRYFNQCTRKAVLLHAHYSSRNNILTTPKWSKWIKNPIYYFNYAHNGDGTLMKLHGTGTSWGEPFNQTYADRMLKLWVSFMNYGAPVATWGSTRNWSPVTRREAVGYSPLSYYKIAEDTALETETEGFKQRMEFWENLPLGEFENDMGIITSPLWNRTTAAGGR